MILDCPALTFLIASSPKCCNASSDNADWWGPRSTASQISSLVQGCPVLVGHPIWDHSRKSSPVGCDVAIPDQHMSPRHVFGRLVAGGSSVSPACVVHVDVFACCCCSACRRRFFLNRSFSISLPTTSAPVASMIGGSGPLRASYSFACLLTLWPLELGPGACTRGVAVSCSPLGRRDSKSVTLPQSLGCIEYPLFGMFDGLLLFGLAFVLTSPRGSLSAHLTENFSPVLHLEGAPTDSCRECRWPRDLVGCQASVATELICHSF